MYTNKFASNFNSRENRLINFIIVSNTQLVHLINKRIRYKFRIPFVVLSHCVWILSDVIIKIVLVIMKE